jgi:hypothetical protein
MKKRYFGILLGAIYGITYRFLCEYNILPQNDFFDFNIYSVSFIWVLPIVISIIPILVAQEEMLELAWRKTVYPMCSVLLFFIFALTTGLEDLLCILILTLPFLISAAIVGIITVSIIKKINSKKLYSILLLPFIIMPIESQFQNRTQTFSVESFVIINAEKSAVWDYIIEVPEITEAEYDYGFFNYIGIPRPVKSQLEMVNGSQFRVGYFSDDLKLYEAIGEKDSLNFVNFKINLEQSQLRDLPTDKHLLQSDYFRFDDISYRLEMLENGQTKLILNCRYTMQSKMNGYANFWATKVIEDFEMKLLKVLKRKVERTNKR